MTTLGGFMDPFAMFDPQFFDVSGMGLPTGDLGLGAGGWGTTGTRRRATMPADVLETPVRARARACLCARACSQRVCAAAARAVMCVGSCALAGAARWNVLLSLSVCAHLTRVRWRCARAQNDFVMMMCVPRARARRGATFTHRRRCTHVRPWTDEASRCARARTYAHDGVAQGHSGRQAGGHQPGD
jgi:hypothetical protein